MADSATTKGPNVQFATALVYWGAAFLVLILGFRAILETLELASLKMPITYLAGVSLLAEFSLLLFYGYTIYRTKPAEASSVFPQHLTQEIESMIAQMKDAANAFLAISSALQQSAGTVEARAEELRAIAAQSQADSARAAEAAERRAAELQAIAQQAFTVFTQSSDTYEKSTQAIQQANEGAARLLGENQAFTKQSLDAFIRSTQAFQDLAASFKTPLAALESTASSLSSLTEQEYRRKVLADIMLGLDRTMDEIRDAQSTQGSAKK